MSGHKKLRSVWMQKRSRPKWDGHRKRRHSVECGRVERETGRESLKGEGAEGPEQEDGRA